MYSVLPDIAASVMWYLVIIQTWKCVSGSHIDLNAEETNDIIALMQNTWNLILL